MDRRTALRWLAATMTVPFGASVMACSRTRQGTMTTSTTASSTGTMPVVFIAHGAPPLLDDEPWKAELAAWSKAMPRPKAILSLSAHWEAHPIAIGATTAIPLVYDFYGFPQRYYELQYPAPGAPELAARIRDLLRGKGIAFVDDPGRGLDHGTYVPLMSMYPEADVPVLQVSLPGLDPKELYDFGRALAPLRNEGVLIAGSGFLTHNMRALGESHDSGVGEGVRRLVHGRALASRRRRARRLQAALALGAPRAPALGALRARDHARRPRRSTAAAT